MTDLTGRVFGQLTVLHSASALHGGRTPRWVVRCTCGAHRVVGATNLKNGNTRSCGCAEREGKGLARAQGVREAAAQRAERDSQRAVRDYLARREAKREPMMGEGEWMA